MLSFQDNIHESEAVIVLIINSDDVALETKQQVLVSQSAFISSIDDIDNIEVKEVTLDVNKVVPIWENVFSYYDTVG